MLSSFFRTITFDQDQEHKCGIPCSTISQNWRNFLALYLSWNQFIIQLLKTTGLLRGPLPVQHSHLLWNEIDSLFFSSSYIWTIITIFFPKGQPGHDPLHKIRPFLDKILDNFQSSFQLGRKVSLDESMIGFKGRLGFVQYIPKKPTKWGLKAFVVSDSVTGYAFNWVLYTGKLLFSNIR